MKKTLLISALFLPALALLGGCGSKDAEEAGGTVPTVDAAKVKEATQNDPAAQAAPGMGGDPAKSAVIDPNNLPDDGSEKKTGM